jgi:hypothetical protein
MSSPSVLVQHLPNYSKILRDDGLCHAVAEVERRLRVVQELESVVSANLQRATRLRRSILQKAFSGKLATSEASG